jgi:hypothetical protein
MWTEIMKMNKKDLMDSCKSYTRMIREREWAKQKEEKENGKD